MSTVPEALPTLQSIASYAKKHTSDVKSAQKMHHGEPASVQTEEYNGHEIVVTTKYHIEVDGVPLMGHFSVDSDGHTETHALPNYEFTTPMNFVKKLIDEFPQDFTSHGGHSGHGGMPMGGMRMGGMRMSKKSKPKKKAAPKKAKSSATRKARKGK